MSGAPFKISTQATNKEIQKAVQDIGIYDGKMRLAVEKAVRNGGQRVGRGAKNRVAARSGKLKRSIRTSFSRVKIESSVKVYMPHAHLIEFGTKPHALTKGSSRDAARAQKRRKTHVLVVNGRPIDGSHVVHPGSKARPFLRPAYESEVGRIIKDVKKAVEKP